MAAHTQDGNEQIGFWAIVELFGHTRIAGKITEATIGSCSFVRVDVPELDAEHPAFTKLYGNGAIYSLSPVEEEIAMLAVKQYRSRPVDLYRMPAARQLPEPGADIDEEEEDEEQGDF